VLMAVLTTVSAPGATWSMSAATGPGGRPARWRPAKLRRNCAIKRPKLRR